MSLHIAISVNGRPIESVTCTRRESFNGKSRVYTYDVRHLNDVTRHIHYATIKHKYSDGSLVLVRKAVQAIAAEVAAEEAT